MSEERWSRTLCVHQALTIVFKILRDGSAAARTRGGCVVALAGSSLPSCLGCAKRTAILLVSGCVHLATATCFAVRVGSHPPVRQLRQLRLSPSTSPVQPHGPHSSRRFCDTRRLAPRAQRLKGMYTAIWLPWRVAGLTKHPRPGCLAPHSAPCLQVHRFPRFYRHLPPSPPGPLRER